MERALNQDRWNTLKAVCGMLLADLGSSTLLSTLVPEAAPWSTEDKANRARYQAATDELIRLQGIAAAAPGGEQVIQPQHQQQAEQGLLGQGKRANQAAILQAAQQIGVDHHTGHAAGSGGQWGSVHVAQPGGGDANQYDAVAEQFRVGVGEEDVARLAEVIRQYRVELCEDVQVGIGGVALVPVGVVTPTPPEALPRQTRKPGDVCATRAKRGGELFREVIADHTHQLRRRPNDPGRRREVRRRPAQQVGHVGVRGLHLVDPDGPDGKPYSMMESGAILIYLAGKTGRFLPQSDRLKYDALQWLMFQMAGVGPIFGQVHHFLRAAKEPVPYAIARYTKEKDRLYGVLNERLAQHEYLADEYSVADIATYPWVARFEWHKTNLADFPHVKRWFDAINARPAVQRGLGFAPPGKERQEREPR